MKNKAEVESPCVRNCCIDQQDMCLGCFRSITEILEWSNVSTEKRSEIIGLSLQRKENRQ